MKLSPPSACTLIICACFYVLYALNIPTIGAQSNNGDTNSYQVVSLNDKTFKLTPLWMRSAGTTPLEVDHTSGYGRITAGMFHYNGYLYIPIFKEDYTAQQRIAVINASSGESVSLSSVPFIGSYAKRRYEDAGVDEAGTPWIASGLNYATKYADFSNGNDYQTFLESNNYISIAALDLSEAESPKVIGVYEAEFPKPADMADAVKVIDEHGNIKTFDKNKIALTGIRITGNLSTGNFTVYANAFVRHEAFTAKVVSYQWTFVDGKKTLGPSLIISHEGTPGNQADIVWLDDTHLWLNSSDSKIEDARWEVTPPRYCEYNKEDKSLDIKYTLPISDNALSTGSGMTIFEVGGEHFLAYASQTDGSRVISNTDRSEIARFAIHALNDDGTPVMNESGAVSSALWTIPSQGMTCPVHRTYRETLTSVVTSYIPANARETAPLATNSAHTDIFIYAPDNTLAAYRLTHNEGTTGVDGILQRAQDLPTLSIADKRLIISSPQSNIIDVFDLSGRLILRLDINDTTSVESLSRGIYTAFSFGAKPLKFIVQ